MKKGRQPSASDSGGLPEPWPGTEKWFRQDKKKQIMMERTAPNPDEDPQDTKNNQILNPHDP